MTKVRFNQLGQVYYLTPTIDGKTQIATQSNNVITVDMDIETVSQCWYNWQQKGEYIQVAFAQMPARQREFLMTGITPEHWDRIFGAREDYDHDSEI